MINEHNKKINGMQGITWNTTRQNLYFPLA